LESLKAYSGMNIPFPAFLAKRVLPVGVGCLALAFVIKSFLAPHDLVPVYLLYGIPAFVFAAVVAYPVMQWQKKRSEIDHNMHLFITRMGSLATTDLPRKKLFKLLSEVKDYGALSDEVKKIYVLMDNWHFSLSEAARYRSKKSPSVIFSDFLERMAHAIDSGEDFRTFLRKEQSVIMAEYSVMYRGALKDLDVLKEIFVALVAAAMFMIVFTLLLPMLFPISTTIFMLGSLFILVAVEGLVLFFVRLKLPRDDVWQSLDIRSTTEKKLRNAVPVAFAASVVLFVVAWVFVPLPITMLMAMASTPLAVLGYVTLNAEKKVKRCDESFDSFMRSVGATSDSIGGSIEEGLKRLQKHDFGPLTEHIGVLHNRLASRVDKNKAWRHFSAETGSNLITKFTEMYTVSLMAGGKSSEVSEVISDNFLKMVGLRKERYQSSMNFVGILYGLTLGISVTIAMAIGIMGMMEEAFSSLDIGGELPISLGTFAYEPLVLYGFQAGVIMVHSLVSAWIIRLVSGGHRYVMMLHFSGMFWLGAIVSLLAEGAMLMSL